MTRIYLWTNAAIYLLLGAASAINPDRMARAAGYFTLDNSGSSEFLVLYAGLELGLALFFIAAARTADLARPAILFSLCLYGGIVAFRLPSLLLYHPVRTFTLILAAGEVVMLLAAAWLARKLPRSEEEEASR